MAPAVAYAPAGSSFIPELILTDTTVSPATVANPYFLDCDTGIDDSLALAYLLASEKVNLVGIGTVAGNTSAEQGARNSLDLLALVGRSEVPVAVGATGPQSGEFDGGVPHIHGDNGVGNVELPVSSLRPVAEPAAEMLVRLAHEYAGELRIVAIGPLTNIAAALRLEPRLPRLVKELTLMGGAAMVPGNISEVAEANVGNDADAASEVFAADWFITMVPLDVTLTNTFEESDRDALLASGRPMPQTLGRILDLYYDFYIATYGRRACALHDPLAAAIAVGDIPLRVAPVVNVMVDATDGPGRGQTICDLRGYLNGYPQQPGAHCRVVLELEENFAPTLLAQLLRA
ncbi:MAG: putative Inosine-uridine preferring nucleoside hydrolase (IunH) [Glaciihabitans sp.]|nr:putative Inosine-uridine preferring nucleoside hydrolase (IunH) [Glaciihabitans sp.]